MCGAPTENGLRFPRRKKLNEGILRSGSIILPLHLCNSRQVIKDIRSTGPFRLPGVSFKPGNLGISATSEKRVITFLPPPLTTASKGSSVDYATLLESTTVEKTSSPTSDDHGQDVHLSVNTGTIARRYPQTQTLKQNVRTSVHLGTERQLISFIQ